MTVSPLIVDLWKKFDQEEDRSLVIRALRQDQIIWKSLEEPELRQKALDLLPSVPQSWSPGSVALLTLEDPPIIEDLEEDPLQAIPDSLIELATQAYQVWSKSSREREINLLQSCLLALYFREQRRQFGNWNTLQDGLRKSDQGLYCPAACLLGMVPYKLELVRELVQAKGINFNLNLSLHVLFSNPLPQSKQVDILQAISNDSSPIVRLELLNQLSLFCPEIADMLAKSQLDGSQEPLSNSAPAKVRKYQQLTKSLYNAQLLSIANKPKALISTLNDLEMVSRRMQADLIADAALSASDIRSNTTNKSETQIQEDEHLTLALKYWKQASNLAPEVPAYTAAYILSLIRSGQLIEAQEVLFIEKDGTGAAKYIKDIILTEDLPNTLIDTESQGAIIGSQISYLDHPALIVASAVLAYELGELDESTRLAKDAVELLNTQSRPEIVSTSVDFTSILADLLYDLNQYHDSIRAAMASINQRPAEPHLLLTLSKSYIQSGQPKEAITPLRLILAQQPERIHVRQLLIASSEASEEWETACEERHFLLNKDETTPTEELQNLAYCALMANHPLKTVEICETLSRRDIDNTDFDQTNAVTYWLLGEAKLLIEDTKHGLEYLDKAMDCDPSLAFPWIALNNHYIKSNDPIRADQILQKASLILPNSPEIQLELGKKYLNYNLPSRALPYLHQANSLLSVNGKEPINPAHIYQPLPVRLRARLRDPVLHYLGKSLRILGRMEEAKTLFEEAFAVNPVIAPEDPALLYGYAQALDLFGYTKKSIPLLENVVRSQRSNLDARVDLAKAIIKTSNQTKDIFNAISILESVTNPTNTSAQQDSISAQERPVINKYKLIEAKTLLAEAQAQIGDYSSAIRSYRLALELTSENQLEIKTRISLGLGSTALELGEIEKSIASLQEGVRYDPKNILLLRKLAEAYLAKGLTDNSFQTAYSAYQLHPSDMETITWFADHCTEIQRISGGSHAQAKGMSLQALERATRISPSRADLYLRRGIAQRKDNDPSGAKASFIKVAEIADPHWEELFQAALNLRQLGDFDEALQLFDLAQQRVGEIYAHTENHIVLFIEYSETHKLNADIPSALSIINQGIAEFPESVDLHLKKTELLLSLSKPIQALNCVYDILQRKPNEAILHLQASKICFINRNIADALDHADQAIALYSHTNDASGLFIARQRAAEMAFMQLQFNRAKNYLSRHSIEAAPVEYKYLFTELNLLTDEEDVSYNDILHGDVIQSDSPRWLAIEIRLNARKKGAAYTLSSDRGQSFLASLLKSEETDLLGLLSSGMAALDIGEWELALRKFRKSLELYSFAPLPHYIFAKALVLYAEIQQVCEVADVVAHAPGREAVSEESQNEYQLALQKVEEKLHINHDAAQLINARTNKPVVRTSPPQKEKIPSNEAFQRISRLRVRGNAAFQPNLENIEAVRSSIVDGSHQPEIIGAWILSQGESLDQETIDKVSQSDPIYPLIWLYLSITQYRKNPELALNFAEKTLLYSSRYQRSWIYDDPIVYGLLAKYSSMAGDLQKALNYIQAALEFWPDEPRWHFMAANITLNGQKPDIDSASKHLENAIRLEPTFPEYYLELGDVLTTKKNTKQAIQVLKQAASMLPENPIVWIQLARAYQSAGDLEQATSYVERAIKNVTDPKDPLLIKALQMQGEIMLEADRPREAIDRAKTILHLQPGYSAAYVLLSRAYEAMSQTSKALVSLDKAIELADTPYTLELDYLRLVQKIEGVESAISKSIHLLDKYPHNTQLIARSAALLVDAGRQDEAIVAAKEALRQDSGELTDGEQAYLHYLIGSQISKEGQLDQAIFHLSQSIQLDPTMIEAYLDLGRVHLDRREFNQAMKIYQMGIEIAPDDAHPYYHCGIALKENKDFVQAEAMLRKAANLAPNDIGIQRTHGALVVLNLVHNRRDITIDADI